jgi:4-hydroxybenzoate polyprenyltransferase
VRIVHPFPVSIVVVSSVILVLIAARRDPGAGFLVRAAGVVLLSQIAVGALNDLIDRHDDARVQPDKPIPSGLVTPTAAAVVTVSSTIALIPAALSFGLLAFGWAVLGTAAGFAYDLWLKPTPFSFLGYICGFLSLLSWAWMVAGHFHPSFLLAYPTAAALLVAAHLAQSLPDVDTDRAIGNRGLAAVLGTRTSLRVILSLFLGVVGVGLGSAAAARSLPALALVIASLAAPMVVLRLSGHGMLDRATRILIFRVMAPGIGALGLGCLLAMASLA